MRKQYVWTGLFLCWTGFASAGAAASDSQVVVEGSQRAAETVRASGHGVPLLRALEQIVPTSYSVNVPNAGAWADTPVSWHGDTPFVRALGEILGSNRTLQAHVNTDLHLVTVTALPASSSAAAASPQAVPEAALIDAPPSTARYSAQTPPMMPQRQAAVQPQVQAAQATLPQPAPLTQRLVQQPLQAQQSQPQQPQQLQPQPLQPQAQAPLLAPPPASLPPHTYAEQTPLLMPHADSPLPQGTPLSLALSTSAQGPAPTPAVAGFNATPAAAAGPFPADPTAARTWELKLSDVSVRTALARWAQDAGWQFIWAVPTDFSIDASATLHGSFEDALHSVVDALSHSQVPIQAVLYKGNHVLRVTAKGAG